ncbi:hypothetical protein BZG36_00081 [Bifiguratus adelaidae]|uniref:Yeast cell wall synthesis Kre9/Knh1-like N-terminal domain-containing protein n=1 Tax=Bifiguratus adelaidae TaxID=1938954 RepID=A0A261Y8F6_9FUNG|nr:hypothetical protein BZG36_00081 [Bifiguratus adelaidae]
MKIIATLSALLAAVAVVSAQTPACVFTQPVPSESVAAGSSLTVAWTSPTVPTFVLTLMQGPPTLLQIVTTLSNSVATSQGGGQDLTTVTIPANIPAGTDYSLRAGTLPNVAYSDVFIITAGSGTASGNTTAPASSVAASTSIPAAGSATSAASTSAPVTSMAATSAAASSAKASSSASASTTAVVSGAAAVNVPMYAVAAAAVVLGVAALF